MKEWVDPAERPCAFQQWARTETKLPWWVWYRIAAQERSCQGSRCAWCPRTRYGRRYWGLQMSEDGAPVRKPP